MLIKKSFMLLVLLVVVGGFTSCSKKESDEKLAGKYKGSKITWYDFNEGLKLAKKEKKTILIDFSADWCKYCHLLDSETFADPKVSKILNEKFICIKVRTDKPNSQVITYKDYPPVDPQGFFAMAGGKGLPFLVFMDENGEIITNWPGFVDANQFLPILSYLDKRCYDKKITFADYVGKKTKDCD